MGASMVSVVWLAIVSDSSAEPSPDPLAPIAAQLKRLGYEGESVPMMCQYGAVASLGVQVEGNEGYAEGLGVYFAEREDADAFVSLYDGPILGIVDGDFFCDFD